MSVEKSGKPVVGGLAEDTDDGSEVFNGRFKVVTEPFAKGRVILGMFVSDASAVYLFHFVDVQLRDDDLEASFHDQASPKEEAGSGKALTIPEVRAVLAEKYEELLEAVKGLGDAYAG